MNGPRNVRPPSGVALVDVSDHSCPGVLPNVFWYTTFDVEKLTVTIWAALTSTTLNELPPVWIVAPSSSQLTTAYPVAGLAVKVTIPPYLTVCGLLGLIEPFAPATGVTGN